LLLIVVALADIHAVDVKVVTNTVMQKLPVAVQQFMQKASPYTQLKTVIVVVINDHVVIRKL
jgi:hypothetical protein